MRGLRAFSAKGSQPAIPGALSAGRVGYGLHAHGRQPALSRHTSNATRTFVSGSSSAAKLPPVRQAWIAFIWKSP